MDDVRTNYETTNGDQNHNHAQMPRCPDTNESIHWFQRLHNFDGCTFNGGPEMHYLTGRWAADTICAKRRERKTAKHTSKTVRFLSLVISPHVAGRCHGGSAVACRGHVQLLCMGRVPDVCVHPIRVFLQLKPFLFEGA